MTISQIIAKNPYLKISNLTDVNDADYSLKLILDLIKIYGSTKILKSLYFKVLMKREKLIKKNNNVGISGFHILDNIQGK